MKQKSAPALVSPGDEENAAPSVITHKGVRLPIDRTIMSKNIVDSIEKGRYEHKESAELQRMIEIGERILELGAGLGFISTLCKRNILTEAVRSFEANPLLIPLIRQVHTLNQVTGIEIENAVLLNGREEGTIPFYVRRDFWASSLSPKPFGYEKVIDVPARSFNAEIESFRPSMIICDIEGGELDLFLNANLSGVRKVYIEVHQNVLGRRGMKALFDAFSARNFHYDQWHSSGSVVLFSSTAR